MDNGKAVVTDAELIEPGTPLPWDRQGGTVFSVEAVCCGHPQVLWDADEHGNPVANGEACCGSPDAVQVGPIAETSEQDARYIVHACNEYPKLLARLQALSDAAGAMEAALEPFAFYAAKDGFGLDNHGKAAPDEDGVGWIYLTLGDFRRARTALTKYREARNAQG